MLLQYPGAVGRGPRPAAARRRPRTSAGALVTVAADLLALTLLDAAGRDRAPTSPSAPRSASACRWASAARTPATWRCAPGLERQLPGRLVGVSGRRRRRARPTGWRCRPASSTSAARRRPATSAPRRCCWPSWPACTPSTTARTGCAAIARAHAPATPPCSPPGCAPAASRSCTSAFFDTVTGAGARPGRRGRRGRRASAASTCGWSTPTTVGDRLRRDHHARAPRARCWRPSASTDVDVDAVDAPTGDALPAGAACATTRVPDPPGVPRAPLRDRDAALPAPARRPATSRSTAA